VKTLRGFQFAQILMKTAQCAHSVKREIDQLS